MIANTYGDMDPGGPQATFRCHQTTTRPPLRHRDLERGQTAQKRQEAQLKHTIHTENTEGERDNDNMHKRQEERQNLLKDEEPDPTHLEGGTDSQETEREGPRGVS